MFVTQRGAYDAAFNATKVKSIPLRRGGHIAMVLHDLRGGGAERACLRLARGLVEAGQDIELILIKGEGSYINDVPPGVRLTVLGCSRVSQSIGALRNHIRTTRPRVVFSALTHMNLATAIAVRLAGTGARLVLSERNQISRKAANTIGKWQKLIYRAVPFLYRSADSIVAVSGGVAADLRKFGRFSERKIKVVYNPVFDRDIGTLSRLPATHAWFRSDGPPVVLAVGRLDPQKGFDTLLRAFAEVRAHMECRLVILGEGSERFSLLMLADELGVAEDVDMPGFTANPFSLMASTDLFVLSSRWEGFPNALVEAMACGAPVVATDCPSGPNEILDGGDIAPLVPVDNVSRLATAMLISLQERPDTTRSRVRAERFSVEASVAQHLRIFEG